MSTPKDEIRTPVFLVAMPQVQDPFFQQSVVLLLHHNDEGSFGVIVNRPTEIRVADVLQGMEIKWQGDESDTAFFGGPVQPQLGTVIFAGPTSQEIEVGEETTTPVIPGARMTQHIGDLAELARHPPDGFRLVLGYAGWGDGQLVSEILRNDWLTAPADLDLIFSGDPREVWETAMKSVGLDPNSLNLWTTGNGEGPVN
jgi:putative transcriptional regulator